MDEYLTLNQGVDEFESLPEYMNRPKLTKQEQEDLEKIYQKHLADGFWLVSYVGERPQFLKDQDAKWEKAIKERFGEDSEITRYMTRKTEGFITEE